MTPLPSAVVPAAFGRSRYVPILLTRRGERRALDDLTAEVSAELTPLFVFHRVPTDPKSGVETVSMEDHIKSVVVDLMKTWGHRPAFIDVRDISDGRLLNDGSTIVERVLEEANRDGLKLAPVVGLKSPLSYAISASKKAREIGAAVCLRISTQHWSDLGTARGAAELDAFLARLEQSPETCHLVLDLGSNTDSDTAAIAGSQVLRALPHLDDWMSVTFAGTAMPSSTALVGRDGDSELPRSEWLAWKKLDSSLSRRPSFGDYAISNADPLANFNPLTMDSSAQIRYTIASSWYVARGRSLKVEGTEQIYDLAKKVAAHPEFCGRYYSVGDKWIADAAVRAISHGGQETWRVVTTGHHLTFVVNQIAILLGS